MKEVVLFQFKSLDIQLTSVLFTKEKFVENFV